LLALEDIVMETESSGNTTLGFEQLRRWKDLTIQLLTETVSEMEASALRTKSVGPFVLGQPLRNFRAEASLYEACLLSLNDSVQKHPDRILTQVHETGAGVRTVVSTDLFISYSSKDAEFVTKLAKDLQGRGVSVWWDKWMMKVGDSLHKKIQEGITNSALLCVVLSPYSVSSPWVEKDNRQTNIDLRTGEQIFAKDGSIAIIDPTTGLTTTTPRVKDTQNTFTLAASYVF